MTRDLNKARGGVVGSLPRRDAAFERRILIHELLYGGGFAKIERLPDNMAAEPASQKTIDILMARLLDQGLGVSERILRGDVARVRKQHKTAEARRTRLPRAWRGLIESG